MRFYCWSSSFHVTSTWPLPGGLVCKWIILSFNTYHPNLEFGAQIPESVQRRGFTSSSWPPTRKRKEKQNPSHFQGFGCWCLKYERKRAAPNPLVTCTLHLEGKCHEQVETQRVPPRSRNSLGSLGFAGHGIRSLASPAVRYQPNHCQVHKPQIYLPHGTRVLPTTYMSLMLHRSAPRLHVWPCPNIFAVLNHTQFFIIS